MSEIKEGSIVELKSGGPHMTVARFEDGGENVVCGWFSNDKKKKKEVSTFAIHMLKLVK